MTKPQGQLAKVNGHNIHIRKMGDGSKTIVLLPGWNVPLPSVEFAPLMRELSKKYTVCTIELFGYGHSDGIDTPRTNENYMEEIRQTLSLAGLKPPYILMPYSCSGLYCEYYATKHPEEVEALILLDCTSSGEEMDALTKEDLKELNQVADEYNEAVIELEGITFDDFEYEMRSESPEEYQMYLDLGFTKEEIFETSTVPNDMDTLMLQYIALPDNVKELMAMDNHLADDIPVLLFSSENKDEELDHDEQLELDNYLEEYRSGHLAKLGGKARLVVIKGSDHSDIYYHHEIISKEIDDFLNFD
jgi:pimeloyl-ACP methyl ester carboxylesterase